MVMFGFFNFDLGRSALSLIVVAPGLVLGATSYGAEFAIPRDIFMVKWVVRAEDQALCHKIENIKGNPYMSPGTGVAGLRLWCELVLCSSLPRSQSSSFYTIGLYQGEDDQLIEILSIRETRAVGESLQELNWGLFNSPDLIEVVSQKAIGEAFREKGPKLLGGTTRAQYNYPFRLNWKNEEISSRIKLLAKERIGFPEDFFKVRGWGWADIDHGASGSAPWSIEMLSRPKFRVFRPEGKNGEIRSAYFGEFNSDQIWDAIVRQMQMDSPKVRSQYANFLGLAPSSEWRVTLSPVINSKDSKDGLLIASVIENISDVPRAFLRRNTPFDSSRGGSGVSVTEIVGKEGTLLEPKEEFKDEQKAPTEADCLILQPGESITAVVDLHRFFPITEGLTYQVSHTFDLRTFEVSKGKVNMAREVEESKFSGRWVFINRR